MKQKMRTKEILKPQTLEMRKQRIQDEVNKNTSKEAKEGIKYGIDSKYAELEAQLSECIKDPALSKPV